jgi:hypothetical protein
MYVKKMLEFVLSLEEELIKKGKLDTYQPPTVPSKGWKHWVAQLDLKTCYTCRGHHGKIYSVYETPDVEPPVHPNCRCKIQNMEAVLAGQATKDGDNGADWWLKNMENCRINYISLEEIRSLGWRESKSPCKYAPGKMITCGIYKNLDGHLPGSAGRVWQEADINYYEGKRNKHRILFSNDGLMFVTYDHYETFNEII